MKIRISPNEKPMEASKWLDVQALLDGDEMACLLEALNSPYLFLTGCVCAAGHARLTVPLFLEAYCAYIDSLKHGNLPDEKKFRPLFSAALTATVDVMYAIPLKEDREILRICKPVIQMQFHRLGFSEADRTFRPMAFGSNTIFWGIQFSYPQLFQDLNTHEVYKVIESERFPNTSVFRTLQRWMRQHTIPTPFVFNHTKINASMRLGKRCLSWINHHPQLNERGLSICP